MTSNFIITLGFFFFYSVCNGQYNYDMDLSRCQEFSLIALSKLKNDSIFIPKNKYELSRTAIKIFENDYGLINRDPVIEDVLLDEIYCFDNVMELFIKCKYGEEFIDSIINYSKLLDSKGRGYVESGFLGEKSLNALFKENYVLKELFLEYENLIFVLSFDVDTLGNVINLVCYDGLLSSGEIKRLSDGIYNDELKRVMNKANMWKPAKLNNRPIMDKRTIVINRFTF